MNKLPLFLWLLFCPIWLMAQDCTCTNCPGPIPVGPQTTVEFEFDIDGATLNNLSSPFQGVCGVAIDFRHSFIWQVEMVLTSPGGQSVTLIGPEIDPPLGSFTGFANWDILFLPCGEPVSPDAGFSPTWDNDQNWQTGGQYSGTYYPFSGCLGDFNTGPVNGTWQLSVTNNHGLYTGLVRDFSVLFCNELGLNCFTCEADAGDLSNIADVVLCQEDSLLNLTLEPKYDPAPPDPTIYDYRYVISESDVILAIDSFPDLRGFVGGTYEICGLSFLASDSLSLPTPNGFSTLSDLRAELASATPDFCGAVSTDCIEVEIIPSRSTIRDTICEGDTYWFAGQLADTTGIYRDTLNPFSNCADSIVTLELLVLDTVLINIAEQFCAGDTFRYRGNEYTSSGSFRLTYPIPNTNCDTTVQLDLVFNPAVDSVLTASICAGESYDFFGTLYDTTGEYTTILPALGDCDTTATLRLTVLDSIITNLTDTLCAGGQFTIGTTLFTETGQYEVLLPALSADCDSLIRLDLTILDSIKTTITDTICFGESYEVGTERFDVSGEYTVRLAAAAQCDSFVLLNLTVLEAIETDLVQNLCAGDSLMVGDSVLTESGLYNIVLTSFQNCDSLVQVDLTIQTDLPTNLEHTLCQGQSITIGDSTYTQTGAYTTLLTGAGGCDSLVVLDLVVLNPTAVITAPDSLDCDFPQIVLEGMAPTSIANVTYQWTHLDNGGGGIVSGANTATPTVARGGQYELVVTETYQNVSCTASAVVEVFED
ncbi:MAG: hypothetical protein AAGD05_10840, partial [Bacteroidota bacterium]